jgi:hypothetical protein
LNTTKTATPLALAEAEDAQHGAKRGGERDSTSQRPKHHEEWPPIPRGRIPKSLTPKPRMAHTLRTLTCSATYQLEVGRPIDTVTQIHSAAKPQN